jgi:thymidylate kinase
METDLPFPCLVHFFGPDGAGKSLQANILASFLNRRGFKVKKCWVRSPHTLAFLLWRIFVKIGFYRTVYSQFGTELKLPAIDCNKSLRLFWAVTEFFSVLPLIMRIRVSMLRGYKLVADRFILDTVTTVAFFINDVNFLKSRISRLFFLLIPKGTVFIFLDSDFRTIFSRRAHSCSMLGRQNEIRVDDRLSRSSCDIEPQEFIDFQRTSYKTLAEYFDALKIDTSKRSIEETSEEISRYLHLLQ